VAAVALRQRRPRLPRRPAVPTPAPDAAAAAAAGRSNLLSLARPETGHLERGAPFPLRGHAALRGDLAQDNGVPGAGGAGEGVRPAVPGFVSQDGEGYCFLGFGGQAVVVGGLYKCFGK